MKIIINNVSLGLDEDLAYLKKKAAKTLSINENDLINFRIVKESIDARRKNNIRLIYSTTAEINSKIALPSNADVRELEEKAEERVTRGDILLKNRPVIVGSGPAGLFAALTLAENGYKPLLIERGDCVEKRVIATKKYWETGELDEESNTQFGEGGAGTFSDGKLTTRINDPRCEKVLNEFNKSGISEEVLYKAKPHIGTDNLKRIMINIRNRILALGGEIKFRTKMKTVEINSGAITGIVLDTGEVIPAEVAVIALGHSARDTFRSLYKEGVIFEQKPFSIGVRVEHLQSIIDKAQFGNKAGHPKLGSAEYQLFYKTGGRTVYTFCMCPGGVVVASASERGTIVTNGMSEFARAGVNANSAWVVSVDPSDFGSSDPLAGIEFQRIFETAAFTAGGGDNSAPIQLLKDFVAGNISDKTGAVKPSYTGSTAFADINNILPKYITDPMKGSIGYFDGKLKGFALGDAVLTGVETRTSSPVRIKRDDSYQALGVKGLYPAGEGAGYAGGIVSAAVDGLRIAEQIIKTYKPL